MANLTKSVTGTGTASLAASVANLVKTIIGAGILGVPWAFGQTGELLGAVLLLFVGIVQAFALHLLALLVLDARARGEKASFHYLANLAFGRNKALVTMVESTVFLGSFGVATSQLFTAGDLIPQVCEYLGIASAPWSQRVFWTIMIGVCVQLPLMCLQKLDSLKVTSVIGNFGIACIVVATCLFASNAFDDLSIPVQEASVLPPPHTAYTSFPGLLESIPIFITTFSCAQNIPSLALELHDSTIRRVDTMICVATAMCTVIFLLVGWSGILAFGASINGNLLLSFPSERGTTGAFVATIARAATVLNVIGSYPLFMHPARTALSQLLFRKAPADLSRLVWSLVTGVLFIASLGAAIALHSLEDALSLIGGTGGMLVGFTFPAIFYCRLGTEHVGDSYKLMVDVKVEQQGRSALKASVCLLAVVSLALIPLLVFMQVVLMASGD